MKERWKRRLFGVVGVAAALFVAGTAAAGPQMSSRRARFVGYVAWPLDVPTHVIRNGFVNDAFLLAFRDYRRAHTRYRVCWRGDCWTRTTGRPGVRSVVKRPPPARGGGFVRWYVKGRQVARWWVTIKYMP